MNEEQLARMGLAATFSPGQYSIAHLVAATGAVELWKSLRSGRGKQTWVNRARAVDLDDLVRATQTSGSRFIIPGDAEWPTEVDDLIHANPHDGLGGPPLGLWLKGAPWEKWLRVSIVGSRACTTYGEEVARDFGYELAVRGVHIVSGGAYGVDAAAHRGALAAHGITTAVLACGINEAYPAAHRGLFSAIANSGTLITEHPPHRRPTRSAFLSRNRLIAALSQGTVIVQAAARSGAASTASWTCDLSRELMAVPGDVTCAQSITPHRLIREQRAVLVSHPVEVLSQIAPIGAAILREAEGELRVLDTLSPCARSVLDALPARGSSDVDSLVTLTEYSVGEVLSALEELAAQRLVDQRSDESWGLGQRRADSVMVSAQPTLLEQECNFLGTF